MSTVRFEEEDGLGVLTLDSPPLNLLGQELIGDLAAAFDQIWMVRSNAPRRVQTVPRISVETENGSDIELHYDKALLEFIAAPARQPVGSERP